jgi:hypothetical protein
LELGLGLDQQLHLGRARHHSLQRPDAGRRHRRAQARRPAGVSCRARWQEMGCR